MNWTMRNSLLALGILAGSTAAAQFTSTEKKLIENGLTGMALSEKDLGFARLRLNARFSPNLTKEVLESPIEGLESIFSLHQKASTSLSKSLIAMHGEYGIDSTAEFASVPPIQFSGNLPPELVEPVTELIQVIASSNAAIKNATSKLSLEEKRLLMDSMPQWASIGTDIKSDLSSKPKTALFSISQIYAKVNMSLIREASIKVAAKIDENLPKLREAATFGWKGAVDFNAGGVNVEVAGVGDDVHEARESGLCIDLGGRNRFTGRYGSGQLSTSVLIDFGNDTIADLPDGAGGSGILGIGIACWMGLKPDLTGKCFCLGSGVAGVGVAMVDQAARIESRAFGQGFGMAGLGLMVGSKGSDNFKIGYLGQGSGMMSGIGWLFNPAGNDRYRAGGLVADGATGGAFLGRSQGFSGILAGGIGLLTDLKGDDLYDSGTETQGCATTQGIGSLSDAEGRDTYVSDRKAQAFSLLEGAASLLDLKGDDIYAVRFGECHGCAFERSTAFFLDREGDDLISSREGQPGSAQEGSVAIFLDGQGSNRITGITGTSFFANGRSGIGLFLIAGNDQKIADGPSGNTIEFRKPLSVSYSEESIPGNEPNVAVTPGSIRMVDADIDVLWEQVNLAGNKSVVASRQLLGVGMRAFERFVDLFAAGSTQRARRVAANLLIRVPETRGFLVSKMNSASLFTRGALFDVASISKVPDLQPFVDAAFDVEATRREAIRYAASTEMNDSKTVNRIAGLLLNSDLLTSQESAIALEKLADIKLFSSMQSLLGASDLLVRGAAVRYLAKFPEGQSLAKSLIAKPDDKSQLQGIEILGAIGNEEALRLAGAGLNSPHRIVRIKTLNVLSGRVPESYRPRILELTKDANSLISGLAKSILLN
jgi:hypothetical protein